MLSVLVNPVAGIGGPAGLSGSDGAEIQRLAASRGSRSQAHERMVQALARVAERRPGTRVLTAAGSMGADAVREAGLVAEVVYSQRGESTGSDTTTATKACVDAGADLVLFSGGDGTARDVAAALPTTVAGLGVPSGVKMYSGVFAVAPLAAGALAASWLDGGVPTVVRDVLDIDEDELRRERVAAKLFGSMRVPLVVGRTQARKNSALAGERDAIIAAARGVVARIEPDRQYAIGPGGTMQEVARLLGYAKAPLGVDIVRGGEVLVSNASELQLLDAAAAMPLGVIVSVIGGQGFVIGRGNQQLSHRVLDAITRDDFVVVAPEQKLIDLQGQPLLIDSGSPETDARFGGIVRVVTGKGTQSLYRLRASDREEIHAA